MPDPANILILRRLRPGAQAAFDQAVRAWIPTAIGHPGYLGVFLLEPGTHSAEHGALLRFQSMADWERFREWEPYTRFLADIRPFLLEEPRIELLHGLEAWFNPGPRHNPPRWKMALLTWLGVNAMVLIASRGVGAVAADWPRWAAFLTTNALVVAGLTWLVMPLLVRAFGPWLGKRSS